MMALVSSFDLTIWMPLYICYLQDIYYTNNDSFYVICNWRGQCNRITNRKKCDADERGQSSIIMVCLLYQTSLLLKCKYTSVQNTVVLHKA